MTLQQFSALAIVTSAVLYLLAFLSHSLEWASLRGVAADAAEESRRAQGERVARLVGVGGAASGGTPVEWRPAGSSSQASATDRAARSRAETYARLGVGVTAIGVLSQAVGVVTRGLAAHRAPWGNMYEFVISSLLVVAVVYLALVIRYGFTWLGLPVSALLSVGLGLAATVFYVAVAPLVPALHSVWFLIHILAACIAGAAFNIGGAASIMYLVKARAVRRGVTSGYLAKLPDLGRLDLLAYRSHAFAFPVWTFTIAAGSIWAEYAWGRYWGWDPKETWAFVTWVVYAGYLHARATAGWRGRNAAWIALVGLGCFWFNFIGINLFVNGLHSYAGI